jgi:hypothetical protein
MTVRTALSGTFNGRMHSNNLAGLKSLGKFRIPKTLNMLPIDNELIRQITNGDLIVRGTRDDILKKKYEDGWHVVKNLHDSEELEVERSGMLTNLSELFHVKQKLSYYEFVGNDWYVLDAGLH